MLLTNRDYTIGTVPLIEVGVASAGDAGLRGRLVQWGLALSRAGGAAAAQVWLPRGKADLSALGLEPVRPWWRMDRDLTRELSPPQPVAGYGLRVGAEGKPGAWADVHNRSFADHWRYSPRTEGGADVGAAGRTRRARGDGGRQPCGVTLAQGRVVPGRRSAAGGYRRLRGHPGEHRRKGLAQWLVADSCLGFGRGARTASLYVDGLNPTGAPRLYRDLGFEVAFETEVWEATFP